MHLFRVLHHWLVPHDANNHRAKALHHDSLLAYVLLLAVFNLGIRFFHGTMPDVLGYATDIRLEQLLTTTNARRAEAGLESVSLNGALSQAAAAKASDMFANNYWAHNSPQGKTPWDFIIGSGYSYTLAGENLAKNFQTSTGVVDAWMASPTHKANIVKPGYRDVGFAIINGVLNGEETTLVVQMFGTTNQAPIAQVPKVEAAMPKPIEVPIVESSGSTAVVTTPAPQILSPLLSQGLSFERVIVTPSVNIPALTSNVVYIVVGLLIGLLAVDAFVVRKKRIVRFAGHNVAHIFFLITIVVGGLSLVRGSLL